MKINIRTVNAAFGETEQDKAAECARILRALADKIDHLERLPIPRSKWLLDDINGDYVGDCRP